MLGPRTRSLARTALGRRGLPWWADAAIALLLFAGSAIGGSAYWKSAVSRGQPFYYQHYFEPAVMVACGKGFFVARPQVDAMVPFLWRQADRFSCDAIPADAPLGTRDMYQGSWRYLMYAVGLTWRVVGISWSALAPLFGLLFGATIAAAYAVLRLGMSPFVATLGALALTQSNLHLSYMPHLRDYSKAPFTLALLFLLGLLVTGETTARRVLGLSALYGAVLGFGYGVRTDLLADLPPLLLALFFFMKGGVLGNMRLKVAAGALSVAMFLATAWPIVSAVSEAFGCQWHTVMLGFATTFSRPLSVIDGPYAVNREYLDEYAYTTSTSYAGRVHPGIGHLDYCLPPHEAAVRSYLMDVVTRFPADIVVRAYASVLRIVELPLTWGGPDVQRNLDLEEQPPKPQRGHGIGLAMAVAAIGLGTAQSLRIGLFLLGSLLFFAGYPAIQFDARNYFHFEIIPWWCAGFVVQCLVSDVWPIVRDRQWSDLAHAAARSAVVVAAGLAALVVLLWAGRFYQQRATRSLLTAYLAAPRVSVPLEQLATSVRAAPHTDPETADFIAVDVNAAKCGEHPTVAFKYDERNRRAYSRTFAIHRDRESAGAAGLTHIMMPIYEQFDRIELSDAPPGCVDGVYRVREPGRFRLLLEVMLPPGWKNQPLYQRLQ